MQTSSALDKISPALVKAQSELKHAIKDSSSEAFKRNGKAMKYADLTAVWDAAKPVLSANKLAVMQDVVNTDVGMGVRTRILHESGQWIEFDPPIIPLTKRDAHGAGSCLTYGRRYSLSAALGVVADDDDDGNAAVAASENDKTESAAPKPREIKTTAPKAPDEPKPIAAKSPAEWAEKFVATVSIAPSIEAVDSFEAVNHVWLVKLPQDLYDRCTSALEKRMAFLSQAPLTQAKA